MQSRSFSMPLQSSPRAPFTDSTTAKKTKRLWTFTQQTSSLECKNLIVSRKSFRKLLDMHTPAQAAFNYCDELSVMSSFPSHKHRVLTSHDALLVLWAYFRLTSTACKTARAFSDLLASHADRSAAVRENRFSRFSTFLPFHGVGRKCN